MSKPRPEYPRPDFERTEWLNLNGEWQFEFDDAELGERERWFEEKDFSGKIIVPFCYQSKKSGIGINDQHEVMWYRRRFNVPESWSGKRIILNFGAVDFRAKVWVNNEFTGSHKGGYVPFKFDITNFVKSWGVRNIISDLNQQDFARMLYYLTKALDNSRPVSTNDGWEQVKSHINAIHDYVQKGEQLFEKYKNPENLFSGTPDSRLLYAFGEKYEGQPVLITEFGGIAFASDAQTGNPFTSENWGYGYGVKGEEDFIERFGGLIKAIRNTPYIKGYCYTQLTDVMQEVNGLMTMEREMKVNINKIKEVVDE